MLGAGALGIFGHSGRLPTALVELELLRRLDSSGNLLVGPIPAASDALKHLLVLDLYRKELTGAVSPELGKLTELGDSKLSGNGLPGYIRADLQPTNHDFNDSYLAHGESATSIPSYAVCDVRSPACLRNSTCRWRR